MEKIYTSMTDNTAAELGFKYQYLLAFDLYMKNTQNEDYIIQVEREADIALFAGTEKLVSIEVKHSEESTNMTKSSEDFWKTIANGYKQEESGDKYPKYNLYTNRKDKTGFNEFKEDEKLDYLKSVDSKNVPYLTAALSNSKRKYYFTESEIVCPKNEIDYIKIDSSILKSLIKKFEIIQLDENYFELKKQLIDVHKTLTAEDSKEIIDNIISMISDLEDINSSRKVTIKELNSKYEKLYYQKSGSKLLLKQKAPNSYQIEETKYLKELCLIDLKEKDKEKAKLHYNLAMYNKFEHIKKSPYVACDSIEEYESQLLDYIETIKELSNIKLESEKMNYHITQKELSENNVLSLRNVMVTPVHHKGTSHILVENDRHNWRYDDN